MPRVPLSDAHAHALRVIAEHCHDRAALNPVSKSAAVSLARAGLLWFRRGKRRKDDGSKAFIVRITDAGWVFLREREVVNV